MKLVKYKEKQYTVYNPGSLLKDERGYLLDQLQENLPKMGRYRSVYLKDKYGLTELDYYIIVFLDGDNNNLPKCDYENCNNPKKFNHLLKTKKEPVFECGCCKEHTRILVNRISGRRLVELGISPIYKAHLKPDTEETREKKRQHALEQVKNGTHPWLLKNSMELRNKNIREGKNVIINMWKTRDKLKDLNGDELDIFDKSKMNDIEYVLCSERDSFKYRGNPEDTCYLYTTFLSDPTKFKIGVTTNMYKRSHQIYHGLSYINPTIRFSSTRLIIADLEYSIKKRFIKFVTLGTETFSIELYEEIIKFISDEIIKLSK